MLVLPRSALSVGRALARALVALGLASVSCADRSIETPAVALSALNTPGPANVDLLFSIARALGADGSPAPAANAANAQSATPTGGSSGSDAGESGFGGGAGDAGMVDLDSSVDGVPMTGADSSASGGSAGGVGPTVVSGGSGPGLTDGLREGCACDVGRDGGGGQSVEFLLVLLALRRRRGRGVES